MDSNRSAPSPQQQTNCILPDMSTGYVSSREGAKSCIKGGTCPRLRQKEGLRSHDGVAHEVFSILLVGQKEKQASFHFHSKGNRSFSLTQTKIAMGVTNIRAINASRFPKSLSCPPSPSLRPSTFSCCRHAAAPPPATQKKGRTAMGYAWTGRDGIDKKGALRNQPQWSSSIKCPLFTSR